MSSLNPCNYKAGQRSLCWRASPSLSFQHDFLTFQDRSVMREQSCWRKEGRSAQAFSPSTWELFFGLQCPVHCCGISVKILWSIRYAPSWTIKLKAVSEKWEEVERRINGEEDGTSGHHHLLPLRRHSHLPWTEVYIICSLGRIQNNLHAGMRRTYRTSMAQYLTLTSWYRWEKLLLYIATYF